MNQDNTQGEPAAWRWRFRDAMDSRWRLQNKEPSGDPATFEIEPLYASPPSQPIASDVVAEETVVCPNCNRTQVKSDYDASAKQCIDCFPDDLSRHGSMEAESHQSTRNTQGFEVRVAGPDDLVRFSDELEAHRYANRVNVQYLADRLRHPDPMDEVLCVATVHPNAQDGEPGGAAKSGGVPVPTQLHPGGPIIGWSRSEPGEIHLDLCASADDTMPGYPNCDCGAATSPDVLSRQSPVEADTSVEYAVVQDGFEQFSAPSITEAQAWANAEGPWALSIYKVTRELISGNGKLAASPSDTSGDHLRPPGGDHYDDPAYEKFGLTADHICRMWARYVDQTHAPDATMARLIKGVTADVFQAVRSDTSQGVSEAGEQ